MIFQKRNFCFPFNSGKEWRKERTVPIPPPPFSLIFRAEWVLLSAGEKMGSPPPLIPAQQRSSSWLFPIKYRVGGGEDPAAAAFFETENFPNSSSSLYTGEEELIKARVRITTPLNSNHVVGSGGGGRRRRADEIRKGESSVCACNPRFSWLLPPPSHSDNLPDGGAGKWNLLFSLLLRSVLLFLKAIFRTLILGFVRLLLRLSTSLLGCLLAGLRNKFFPFSPFMPSPLPLPPQDFD